jgi:hypothetical protein
MNISLISQNLENDTVSISSAEHRALFGILQMIHVILAAQASPEIV